VRSEEARPGWERAVGAGVVPTSADDTAEHPAALRGGDAVDWSWPPYAPLEAAPGVFDTPEWAPSSTVEHPLIRVGRWTVLYRRSA
jgi:hypothetical protein